MLKRFAQRLGWGRAIGFALLLALVALRVWDPAPLKLLRLKTFDLYQIAKPREMTQFPVLIVDIDEPSLKSVGQWPWPRHVVAKLIQNIAVDGAAAIGLDMVFAEADRTSPKKLADSLTGVSENTLAELRAAPSHDAIFANIIARTRTVIGQSAYDPKDGDKRPDFKPTATFATLGASPEPFLINYPAILTNVPELESATNGRGMFTMVPDPDGVVRRVPVVVRAGGKIMPSLGADMLRLATGQKTFAIRTGDAGIEEVVLQGVSIPTDENAQLWVYYTPHDKRRYVSAADVLSGNLKKGTFAGKLVFLGTSATGLFDLRTTPIDPVMPGVELHVQALENILTKSSLLRPGYTIGAELTLAFVVGIAFLILIPILGAMLSALFGAAITAGVAVLAWYMFTEQRVLLDVVYPSFASLAVFATMVFVNYVREEAERQQIRGAFSQYISPDLVEQLAEEPDRLTLGGETRELSILFSDVRGFTSISETYKENPQDLTLLLNRLLTPLSHAVLEYKGTIDKYMGDAIMAFWNAPLDDEDHADDACRAALLMMKNLDILNAEREEEAKTANKEFLELRIGIGINTGECVVGNMGSDMRFDYSVLGDSVNLAARLEGQSGTYGLPIILGSATADQVKDKFAVIELDMIRVKGKLEPETIYGLFGTEETVQSKAFQALSEEMTTFLAAYRGRKWAAAKKSLDAMCKLDVSSMNIDMSGFAELFGDRIAEFRKAPPPKNWDGVFTMTTK